ncbi:MAG TPA: type I phosphomannose isomerase catalytic subunit [Acidobacteriaceae bacterium]|jgi:mannose-6-phosphate isomerase
MESELGPFRLAPWFSERPWGRLDLRPWYVDPGTKERVGEAWLTGPASVVETGAMAGQTLAAVASEAGDALLGTNGGGEFPLLVKLLFPSDKLSVQVHPDDAQAQAMGQARGKTECWYVLEAEAGATIALGMKAGASTEVVRAAIENGTMEEWMEWVPVEVGDMVFVDAGTVHAIGPGVVLLETQQTSDTTFRMYDYGRPRELHVEQALGVMKTKTAAGKVAAKKMDGFTRLIEQKYFVVDRYDVAAGNEVVVATAGRPGCLVGLSGVAAVIGGPEGEVELFPGRAVVVPAGVGSVTVEAEVSVSFVRCWAP